MRSWVLGLLAVLAVSCSQGDKSGVQRPLIVATTGMIGDALMNIAGDTLNVVSIMGPGVDPHLYKATQGDLTRLSRAEMIFYNGLHLEGKMGEVLEKLGRTKPVIAVTEDIDKSKLRKVPEFNNNYDPHIWFDVSLWKEAVLTMNSELGEQYPELKDHFDENASKYTQALDTLHIWVKENILRLPEEKRVLITAHDAFGYFGVAYDMEVRGLQGISTLSEFGLRDISDLVDYIVDNKIKAVFVETSVSERAINAVVEGCKERGFPIKIGGNLYSDAMGNPGTEEGTYIGMVKSNVITIYESLK